MEIPLLTDLLEPLEGLADVLGFPAFDGPPGTDGNSIPTPDPTELEDNQNASESQNHGSVTINFGSIFPAHKRKSSPGAGPNPPAKKKGAPAGKQDPKPPESDPDPADE
jgi:hypothetical protein